MVARGLVYLRDGSGSPPGTIGAASQLGGSQAGLRLGYGFGDSGRARAYARATIAVQRPEQREIAFGLAFAPLAHLPVMSRSSSASRWGQRGAPRLRQW